MAGDTVDEDGSEGSGEGADEDAAGRTISAPSFSLRVVLSLSQIAPLLPSPFVILPASFKVEERLRMDGSALRSEGGRGRSFIGGEGEAAGEETDEGVE